MSPPFALGGEARELLRLAASSHGRPVYLVGGAIRDAFLKRPTRDLDIATRGARALAAALARKLRASFVVLDSDNKVYRLALTPGYKTVRQIDVAELQGPDIDTDLARRDFTINAMACLLNPSPEKIIDPRGGLSDLGRGILRAEKPDLFEQDPLRILRLFRIAAQLGFSIDPAALSIVRKLASLAEQPAAERTQHELLSLLAQPGCSRLLRLMDQAGVLTVVFPDLEPSRGCASVYYGKGGVLKHALTAVQRADFLLSNLETVFPKESRGIAKELDKRAQGEVDFRSIILLAVLLHDVSKPETAKKIGGRLRFFGHDELGARRAEKILRNLKFSRDHIQAVSSAITHHLRPGNLAHSPFVTDKAAYRFFRDLGPHALSLLLVCWADHASYLDADLLPHILRTAYGKPPGQGLEKIEEKAQKTVRHLQVISHLMRRLFKPQAGPLPEKLISGHDVMKTLGLKPGPRIGKWLERVREAQAVGKIRSRKEALSWLKKRLKTRF